jgi:F-type H+-transporting ATPase subunit b
MEILQSLNINLNAVIINVLGFGILMVLLTNFLFKPVNKMLDERQQDIRVAYDKIEAEQREMQELKGEYEQRLAAIEAEARERIQNAIKEAQGMRDQIVAEANARSRDIVTRAEQEVEREKQQAMVAIREQVVDLALGATSKIIGDGLDDARQRKLITDFIATQGKGPISGSVSTATAEA